VSIRCPAYKCDQTLNIRDMAHILFDNADKILTEDITALMNLTRFKMDHMLLDKKVQHCSTPSCNHIFSKCTSDKKNNGSCVKVCLCTCGASICQSCGQPSHFGISCDSSKRIQREIANGRLEAEFKSLLWLQNNTSPCPKCRFPINKNGGCNHVRCSKCNYYFCWVCGGDGFKCGSYKCNGTGLVTFHGDNPSYSDSNNNLLANQVSSIRNYSVSVQDLESFLKGNISAILANDEKAIREYQLRKVLTWVRGFLLSAFLDGGDKYNHNTTFDTMNGLELALDQIIEKPDINRMESILNSEKAIVHPTKSHYCRNNEESKTFKRHTNRRCKVENHEASFHEILQLEKMRFMDERQLNAYISSMLKQAMHQMVKTKKQRKRDSDKEEKCSEVCLLNKRMKPLKAPWKGESRFDDTQEVIVEDINTFVKKRKGKNKIRGRRAKDQWKGKVKVSSQREFALSLINDM